MKPTPQNTPIRSSQERKCGKNEGYDDRKERSDVYQKKKANDDLNLSNVMKLMTF